MQRVSDIIRTQKLPIENHNGYVCQVLSAPNERFLRKCTEAKLWPADQRIFGRTEVQMSIWFNKKYVFIQSHFSISQNRDLKRLQNLHVQNSTDGSASYKNIHVNYMTKYCMQCIDWILRYIYITPYTVSYSIKRHIIWHSWIILSWAQPVRDDVTL